MFELGDGFSWDPCGTLGFFSGMQGLFSPFFLDFFWSFSLLCSGGSGVLSHGAGSGLVSMVEFDM